MDFIMTKYVRKKEEFFGFGLFPLPLFDRFSLMLRCGGCGKIFFSIEIQIETRRWI